MATAALVLNHETVYRGLRNSNWTKHGVVNYRAFMLRPANEQFPAEEELSLGLTPQSAVDELAENHGAAGLLVGAVHALPHGLTVRIDTRNAAKANLYGLPLHSTDLVHRDRAITMATDLAALAHFLP